VNKEAEPVAFQGFGTAEKEESILAKSVGDHMEEFVVEKIYFDMDGVLADFERGVNEICGLTPPSQNAKHHKPGEDDEMWEKIKQAEHFYDALEYMPGAKKLFDAVYEKYGDQCEILTGIPKPRRGVIYAAEDKIKWVRRLLSEKVKVNIVFREEKPQYCTGKGCVLIDDMEKNIREWTEMGGTGILNISADETMEQLINMGIGDKLAQD
jgi:5'(3')-deoxyribonucleotidase